MTHAGQVVDQVSNAFEPRVPVGVGERDSGHHLPDAFCRVKLIAFVERPAETIGEQPADGRFAGTGNAHQDQDDDSD